MKIQKMHKLSIREQVLYLVLGCSVLTLLVAGGLALFGLFDVKNNAVEISKEIGETAAEKSSEALKKVTLASLNGLVHERSEQINFFFQDMTWNVNTMAKELTAILQNPQDYSPRRISEPDRANADKIVPQLQYREGVNRAALAYEIGLTANIQDFQVRIFESDNTVGGIYAASLSGFNITTDKSSDRRVDENNVPVSNNYATRPWFQKALNEQKLIFSDVFLDARGRGFGISCAAPYYNANGEIAGIVGEGKFLTTVSQLVNKTTIGESGLAFVMNNKTGQVLFESKDVGVFKHDGDGIFENDPSLFDNENPALVAAAKKMAAGETGMDLVKIDGVSYYLSYTLLQNKDWSFAVAIREDEVIAPATLNTEVIEKTTENFVDVLNNSIKMMLVAIIMAFAAIIALVPFAGKKVAEKVTEPLMVLSDGVREIASGNLDKKIEVNTGNEIEHLASCFNAMTDELKTQMNNLEQVTAEKERIATELNVAKDIQQGMLPKEFNFGRKDFEIYATMNAAKEVGGDFYDFYLLDENHLVMTVADVSGKGIPASLFMVISKTVLKNFATFTVNPDDFAAVVSCANNQLCQNNEEMMFVTVFFGVLEISTGKFTYVNGGHNPPIVYHAKENRAEYLKVKKNFVLGAMDDVQFVQQEIQLENDDLIFAYTDGVNEAMNIDHKEYTSEKLLEFMNKTDLKIDLKEILKNVRTDVAEHVGEAEQSDDITMLALRVKKV